MCARGRKAQAPRFPLPRPVIRERPALGLAGPCGCVLGAVRRYALGYALGLPHVGPAMEQGEGGGDACWCQDGAWYSPSDGGLPCSRLGYTTGALTPSPCPPGVGYGDGPVLKHGPRSAARMRGDGSLIPMYRNESNSYGANPGG